MLHESFPRLALSADQNDFSFRHSGMAEDRWGFQRLSIRGTALASGSVVDAYAVGRVRSGQATLTYTRDHVDTAAPYLRPLGQSSLRLQDAALELLSFEPTSLEENARRYLEGSSTRLVRPTGSDTAPLHAAAGRHWDATRRFVHEVVTDPDLRDSVLVRDQLYDLVLRTFLTSFPVTLDATSVPGVRTIPMPAAIRRALEHIDAHAAEAVSVADLAAVARLSVRALQAGIRRHTGLTPTQYLRDRRLDGARGQLLAADPETTGVADVARTWGFTHHARFSRDYRLRFGEYPRDTLRS